MVSAVVSGESDEDTISVMAVDLFLGHSMDLDEILVQLIPGIVIMLASIVISCCLFLYSWNCHSI